jgi:hypothetical protein
MKLTPAMERYLLVAAGYSRWPGGGIYFAIWAPGRASVGKGLLHRGLIMSANTEYGHPWMLTDAGWKAVAKLKASGRYPQ